MTPGKNRGGWNKVSKSTPASEVLPRVPEGGRAVTFLEQLIQQAAPLLPEPVGPGQTAVAADHAQVGDAVLHQVVRSLQAALAVKELFAAGAADDRAALREKPQIIT